MHDGLLVSNRCHSTGTWTITPQAKLLVTRPAEASAALIALSRELEALNKTLLLAYREYPAAYASRLT